MTKQTFTQKNNGDTLSATEWNELTSYVNTAVDAINAGGGSGSGSTIDTSGVISVSSKGNVTLGSNKNVNIEPAWDNNVANYAGNYGDIAFKPGDDVQFCSHHREPKKRDKVVVKALDGSDNPVKLEVGCGEIAISTKGKAATLKKNKTTGADVANDYMFKPSETSVMDVKILTGNTLDSGTADERDERGYLKVRAQAIDLRCEKHGGVALQPKGYDGDGNMNKIKFEHGGGDGLEFGTFNTEKTSLFTDEYRFNKDGVWKMATRQTTPNSKTVYDDNTPVGKTSTAALQYVKQADDFYDIIDNDDETATTNAIIKTAHALNDGKNRHAKYTEKTTSSGNLKKTMEIETVVTITYEPAASGTPKLTVPEAIADPNKIYTISDFKDAIKTVVVENVAQKYGVAGEDGITLSAGDVVTVAGSNYTIVENFSPSIEITSGAELSLKGKEKLSLGGGTVEFGSDIVDLGEMEDGLYAQYKLTKKNNSKACDVLKVKVINNQSSPLSFDSDAANFAVDSFYPGSDANHPASVSVPGKVETPADDTEANQHIKVVAQCKLIDVIKFVAWAKNNNFGPWAA